MAVVFNPSKSERTLQVYLDSIGRSPGTADMKVQTYVSRRPDDLVTQARRAVDDGHRLVVAAGGDGTVFGVLNGIYGSGAVLSVLPLGTANDLALSLGIASVHDAVTALAGGAVRRIDVGKGAWVDREGRQQSALFCSTAGVGFSAAIAQSELYFPMPILKRYLGDAAFVLSAVKHLLTLRFPLAEVSLDGMCIQVPLGFVEISKVADVGGMALTPFARLDNGCLDACLVVDMSLVRRAHLLLALQFSSRHIAWHDVQYFSRDAAYNTHGVRDVHRIAVTAQQPMPVHLQGEFLGYTPAEFEIVPSALSVLAARSARGPVHTG